MPTNVIVPALELAQETGKVLRWLKAPGDTRGQGRSDRRDRDRQGDGGDRGAGGRTLSASGDKTMFGVVVSRMAKVFKPNFAARGREAVA